MKRRSEAISAEQTKKTKEMLGTYYKKGTKSDYASVDILPGGQDILRITIESIEFHESLRVNGRQEKDVWLFKFAPNPFTEKAMVANVTNRTRVAKAHWNDIVEDGQPCEGRIDLLHNIPVRLTKEEARDVQNGGTTYGLRISRYPAASEEEMQQWLVENGYAQAPAPAAKKVITEDKVGVIVEWALKNGLDMAAIKERYDFESQTVEDAVADGIAAKPQESDDLPE